MPALPQISDFTGASLTEGGFKAAMAVQREYLAGLLGQDGLAATARGALGVPWRIHESRAAAFAVTADQTGTIFSCTGSWTMTLPAVATAGPGFMVVIRNTGTGSITVARSGADTIEGAATAAIGPGEVAVVFWRAAGAWGLLWLGARGVVRQTLASATSAVIFTFAPALYDEIQFDVYGVRAAFAGNTLVAQLSADGGATWLSSYAWVGQRMIQGSAPVAVGFPTGPDLPLLCGLDAVTGAPEGIWGQISLSAGGAGTARNSMSWEMRGFSSAAFKTHGAGQGNTNAANAVRFAIGGGFAVDANAAIIMRPVRR